MTDDRRVRFIGGPANGRTHPLRLPLPIGRDWPKQWCTRGHGNRTWVHYTHSGDGEYLYAGLCATIDHDGPGPGEFRCCCCGKDHE